ncbi:NTF2-like protein [Dichomitus squalens LYAD-421 SS1]|uniref:NTF2-like protein n=1 Tax=Dichomitus squalens (strain LYAD-421) TaxID=732165 RepID=UPI0004412D1F|nr:NTF2-like protein [Dichomitus squalens LYAD-421 SS1]EJF64631.1 NTF2-like protein [Dichomitus squalens LYAD-421 SS1]
MKKRKNGMPAPVTEKVIEVWKEWVRRRWNPEARFLNLERIASDDYLKRHRLTSPTSDAANREAQVIFKIASKLRPEIETISLAHNGLTSGRMMSTMSHYLPWLKNLSLEGNEFRGWKDVDYISGKRGRLEQLRELILVGNPVRELEYKNNRAALYKSEVARRFPSLEILDGEPVARVGFDAPTALTSAPPQARTMLSTFAWNMEPSFIAGVDGGLVVNFLTRFFPSFDNQRGALIDAYAPNATFSFSANTSIPPRARIEGIHVSKEFPNQRKLEWAPWLTGGNGGSRNLGRMNGLQKVTQSLHLGSQEAVRAMAALPPTRHEVAGSPEKFCVDAFPVQQGEQTNLLVTVHGQFAELPSEGIRSFDRSFVLALSPEGSRAKQSGWDVMILSDQLVVRAYSSYEAWKPGPMRVQFGDLLPSPGLQEALAPLPQPQRGRMQDVILRTRLNLQYAEDCLKNNDWDVERAIANFERVKANLPADAYLPQDAFQP